MLLATPIAAMDGRGVLPGLRCRCRSTSPPKEGAKMSNKPSAAAGNDSSGRRISGRHRSETAAAAEEGKANALLQGASVATRLLQMLQASNARNTCAHAQATAATPWPGVGRKQQRKTQLAYSVGSYQCRKPTWVVGVHPVARGGQLVNCMPQRPDPCLVAATPAEGAALSLDKRVLDSNRWSRQQGPQVGALIGAAGRVRREGEVAVGYVRS